jgi:hypothetical protein
MITIEEAANRIRGKYKNYKGFDTQKLDDNFLIDEFKKDFPNEAPQMEANIESQSVLGKAGDFAFDSFIADPVKNISRLADRVGIDNTSNNSTDGTRELNFGKVIDRGSYRDGKALTGVDYGLDLAGNIGAVALDVVTTVYAPAKLAKLGKLAKAGQLVTKESAIAGAKFGGQVGALYGLTEALQSGNNDSALEYVADIGLGGLIGGGLGGVLSGAGASWANRSFNKLQSRLGEQVSTIARDIAGSQDKEAIQKIWSMVSDAAELPDSPLSDEQLITYQTLNDPKVVGKQLLNDIVSAQAKVNNIAETAAKSPLETMEFLASGKATGDQIATAIMSISPNSSLDRVLINKEQIKGVLSLNESLASKVNKIEKVIFNKTIDENIDVDNLAERLFKISSLNSIRDNIKDQKTQNALIAQVNSLDKIETAKNIKDGSNLSLKFLKNTGKENFERLGGTINAIMGADKHILHWVSDVDTAKQADNKESFLKMFKSREEMVNNFSKYSDNIDYTQKVVGEPNIPLAQWVSQIGQKVSDNTIKEVSGEDRLSKMLIQTKNQSVTEQPFVKEVMMEMSVVNKKYLGEKSIQHMLLVEDPEKMAKIAYEERIRNSLGLSPYMHEEKAKVSGSGAVVN